MHVTFNRVLCREDIPQPDKDLLQAIRSEMPSYEPFRELEKLKEL